MENGSVVKESAYEKRRRQWSKGRRGHIGNQTNENSYGIILDIGLLLVFHTASYSPEDKKAISIDLW